MASWFSFFKKSAVVKSDVVAQPGTTNSDVVAQSDFTNSDVVAQPDIVISPKKKKNRQIHWMVTDCTHYRNAKQNVRCTFFSNLRDASLAFKETVESAIDRQEYDFYKVNHDHIKKENKEFFTRKKFDDNNHSYYYHKSREFECGGVYVYLSEVHLGKNYCVELGGPRGW